MMARLRQAHVRSIFAPKRAPGSHLTIELAREWLNGTIEAVACGYGPNGPNVQLKRPDETMALLDLKSIAESLLTVTQKNERLRILVKDAYEEGYFMGNCEEPNCGNVKTAWNDSDTRKDLSNEV